jgi:hypothetical protein
MMAHLLVVGNDMHPEYALGHGSHVRCLQFFFIDSVRMGNDGMDALALTLANSHGWSPQMTGMTSIEPRDGLMDR